VVYVGCCTCAACSGGGAVIFVFLRFALLYSIYTSTRVPVEKRSHGSSLLSCMYVCMYVNIRRHQHTRVQLYVFYINFFQEFCSFGFWRV